MKISNSNTPKNTHTHENNLEKKFKAHTLI